MEQKDFKFLPYQAQIKKGEKLSEEVIFNFIMDLCHKMDYDKAQSPNLIVISYEYFLTLASSILFHRYFGMDPECKRIMGILVIKTGEPYFIKVCI